jgi:carbon storage regulator CsrA
MLVLSRKNGESIRIGQSIEVEVLEVKGGRVKLGISAPRGVNIQRDELRTVHPRPAGSWSGCSTVDGVCTV